MLGFSPLASAPLGDDGVVVIPAQQGAASLVSSSDLSAFGQFVVFGAVDLSANSSTSITGLVIKLGSISLSGSGSVVFLGGIKKDAACSLSADGLVSFTGGLKLTGVFDYTISDGIRVTESGDIRITEDGNERFSDSFVFPRTTQSGDVRVTEDGNVRVAQSVQGNIGIGSLVAQETLKPFEAEVYSKYLNDWKISQPFVNRNGSWVAPERVYQNINGNWKRIA